MHTQLFFEFRVRNMFCVWNHHMNIITYFQLCIYNLFNYFSSLKYWPVQRNTDTHLPHSTCRWQMTSLDEQMEG